MTTLTEAPVTSTANARTSLDEASLPEWMSEPCPSWCCISNLHGDGDPYHGRHHMSDGGTVWLMLEDPHITRADEREARGECSPVPIDVFLFQHYRDREPCLNFIIDNGDEPSLTMGEAAELAAALAALVASAEGIAGGDITEEAAAGRPYWLRGPCPSWCTAPHSDADAPQERAHADEWRQVILTMETLNADARPEFFGVRLEQGWREAEARVVMAYRGRHLNVALAEARELADDLDHFVGEARGVPRAGAPTPTA